ncbi:MAG TPA: SET domain-containing protein-lysine N-methyltransferase [Rhizomicrobium sp.]|nr:SET domain-containing protein-lysine N-methyltransferase [Rhizomicrobium sp.]
MRKISYTKIPGKGRGVIATDVIAAGELVERSPVIPLAHADSEKPGLSDYAFAWGEDVPGFEPGKECAIALGYIGLYNHARPSNVRLERHYAENEMSIHALRDIAPGEELTIDYDIPLWFEPA